jgi:uncharacterized membrane protein YbhN (UPF0104 family)
MPRRRLLKFLEPLLAGVLLVIAVVALRHLLREYSWREILGSLRGLTAKQLAAAAGLTFLGYLTLTFYDVLAIAHIGRRVPYPRVAVTAMSAFTLGHNLGFAPLTALPVRYKLYAPAGLTAIEVGELFAFTSLTYIVGFLLVGGATFSFESLPVPKVVHLPLRTLHPIGWVMLALVAAYLIACARVRAPIHFRGHAIRLPRLRIAVIQIVLSCADWCFAGGTLYALLPSHHNLSYPRFMGAYSLATISGITSHVPGGLGVFEAIILVFLSGEARGSDVAGSLLAYRVVFSLIPLVVAMALLGAFVLVDRARHRRPEARGNIQPAESVAET